MAVEISADKARAVVRVNETLSAANLEALIHELAIARAQMQPEVPRARADAEATGGHLFEEEHPSLMVALLEDGAFRLSMRNSGVGWMGAIVDTRTAVGIAKYILGRAGEVDRIDLLSDGDSQPH